MLTDCSDTASYCQLTLVFCDVGCLLCVHCLRSCSTVYCCVPYTIVWRLLVDCFGSYIQFCLLSIHCWFIGCQLLHDLLAALIVYCLTVISFYYLYRWLFVLFNEIGRLVVFIVVLLHCFVVVLYYLLLDNVLVC